MSKTLNTKNKSAFSVCFLPLGLPPLNIYFWKSRKLGQLSPLEGLAQFVSFSTWISVNFKLHVIYIHNPVFGNPHPCVNPLFNSSVFVQARV